VWLLNFKRRPVHLVWNVALRLQKLFYAFSAFQFIEKKPFQRIIEESPWHSMKTIFGRTWFHKSGAIPNPFLKPHT